MDDKEIRRRQKTGIGAQYPEHTQNTGQYPRQQNQEGGPLMPQNKIKRQKHLEGNIPQGGSGLMGAPLPKPSASRPAGQGNTPGERNRVGTRTTGQKPR